MKKKDLKELGFKKIKVSAEESGDTPFYYYTYDFNRNSGLSLMSSDSDVAKENGKWEVYIFEANLKPFKSKKKLKRYINFIKSLEK